VPAGKRTATDGKWVNGPGTDLFDELKKEFPDMPFVAEDLGEIDQSVYDLRDRYNLPGMKVLQFAFGADNGSSVHIPHNHTFNSVVYTGTHDNNTTKGWFTSETGTIQRKNLKRYTGNRINTANCHLQLIRLAFSSVARLVIIPAQDFLGKSGDARMNTPSTGKGNWLWRLPAQDLDNKTARRIMRITKIFGRI